MMQRPALSIQTNTIQCESKNPSLRFS